jgi:hypothetical protein
MKALNSILIALVILFASASAMAGRPAVCNNPTSPICKKACDLYDAGQIGASAVSGQCGPAKPDPATSKGADTKADTKKPVHHGGKKPATQPAPPNPDAMAAILKRLDELEKANKEKEGKGIDWGWLLGNKMPWILMFLSFALYVWLRIEIFKKPNLKRANDEIKYLAQCIREHNDELDKIRGKLNNLKTSQGQAQGPPT